VGLTIKEIETAKPNGKPYKLVDGGGLCLLIAPSGAKLWRWRYRFDGKEKMMALGEYPLVTLKEARERHLVARKTLDAGIDPMAERKAEADPNRERRRRDSVRRRAALRTSPANGGSGGPLASLRAMRIPSCDVWKRTSFPRLATSLSMR
jgi:hypothetical protein